MSEQRLPNLDWLPQYCTEHRLSHLGLLASGAFKSVFLCVRDGASYALKVMEGHDSLDDRYLREVDALQRCDHPSIAKVTGFERVAIGGRTYWVLLEDYVAGGTLAQLLDRGTPSVDDVQQIGLCIAGAVAHLRDLRIVHRDIKPANILIDSSGKNALLTDFGIARVLDASSLTKDFLAQGPGTPYFAAPEQLTNEKHLVDWRTDQFGLAATLAFCLLGRHPFRSGGNGDQDAIVRVATRRHVDSETEVQLRSLGFGYLLKALEPWPINRYRRPDEFLAALVTNS